MSIFVASGFRNPLEHGIDTDVRALAFIALLNLVGCSSRTAVNELADDEVLPLTPDAAAYSGFTCATMRDTRTTQNSDARDSGVSHATPESNAPEVPEGGCATTPLATTGSGSTTSGPGLDGGVGSSDVDTSATTAHSGSSDPTTDSNATSSAETSEDCPKEPTADGEVGDFECDTPPCKPKQACTCYVETACERGQEGCSGVPVWSITVDQEEFDYINENYREEMRIPGTLCADGVEYELTVEVQGASSRSLPKKNYNLRFDKHNELPGEYLGTEGTIDKLVVKAMASDRSLVRETLGFDLWRDMGHDAPYSGGLDGYVQLLFNGRFNGVYARVEPVDLDYLRRRNMSDQGRLYKGVRRNGGFADFRPERVIEDGFEDETDPDNPNYEVLQELIDVIQDESLSPEEFVTEIANYISVDLIMDRMLWISFTQNGDATAQNFFLHYTPGDEPPWHLIPWDSNLCFGADWTDPENILPAHAPYMFAGNLLAERLHSHAPFQEAFEERYRTLLGTLFTADSMNARLTPLVSYLSVAMDRDRALWGYETDATTAFEELANFMIERELKVAERLDRWP